MNEGSTSMNNPPPDSPTRDVSNVTWLSLHADQHTYESVWELHQYCIFRPTISMYHVGLTAFLLLPVGCHWQDSRAVSLSTTHCKSPLPEDIVRLIYSPNVEGKVQRINLIRTDRDRDW